MPTLQQQLDTLIAGLENDLINQVLNANLPLIGNNLSTAATSATQFLTTLQTDIDNALGSNPNDAAAVVAAITAANISGVSAVLDPADNSKVQITISESATATANIASVPLSFGSSAFGLNADASFTGTIKPQLTLSLDFDPASLALTLNDTPTDELSVALGLGMNVTGSGGGPAEVHIGPLTVLVDDNINDTKTPGIQEFNLNFGLNFHSLTPTDFTLDASGSVMADFGLTTEVSDNLPKILTDLVFNWTFSNVGAGDPTIQFKDVSIDLGSLLGKLIDTLNPILDILGSYPFNDIIHSVTDPLPIIGDAPKLLPFLSGPNGLDSIPLPNGDGSLTFLDLAALLTQDPTQKDTISKFAIGLGILNQLITLHQAGASGHAIDLGTFDVNATTGSPSGGFSVNGTDPLTQANNIISAIDPSAGKVFKDVIDGIKNVLNQIDPNPLGDGIQHAEGLTFPLFDDPSQIIKIFFPSFGDGKPVTFIEYTMPKLEYTASIHEFFPVIGPIGLSLDGDFAAGIQLAIGYDSKGLGGDPLEGFFLTTPELAPGEQLPLADPNPANVHTNLPAAFITADIHAGAGVGFVVASADFEGGFSGGVEAFFPHNDLRISDIGEGCFFDPIFGVLKADVALRITVGFGIFSWTHRIVFAETTLADFSSECSGGVGTSNPGHALAQPDPDLVNGPDLLLNVGDRAGLRSIGSGPDFHNTDIGEAFAVTNAVTTDNILKTADPIPGVITVNAFGVSENFGSADHPMQTIRANLGNGDDTLNVAPDVTQAVIADGGIGNDRIYGGAGSDVIHGGANDDTLVGNGGNDQLFGEAGNDLLDGGPGADLLDGGADFDQVTYEKSTAGVRFTPTTVGGQPGFLGSGGDAQGDTLVSIEHIIGSQFADFLWGNPNQNNILESLAGNDVLIGGNGNDFLLGGPGADFMYGGIGEDGTSYLTSFGGVYIDLQSSFATGGDATGDVLIAMEDVQGSAFDDVLLGNNASNTLDGWFGNDIIDGRAGAPDIITGGDGDDIIYGRANGSKLDGGGGTDLLTYVLVLGPVTVDLLHGLGAGGDAMGHVDSDGVTFHPFNVGFSSFENLTGTNFSDNLTGDLGYNIIRGLSGDDIINGAGGNDTLIGGAGADQMDGGSGIDTADYSDSPGGVFVTLAPLFFPFVNGVGFFSDAQGDSLVNIENLRGSAWADTLIGDNNDNVIDPYLSTLGFNAVPGATADSVFGTLIDNVMGGGGNDTLKIDYSLQDFGQGLVGGFDLFSDSFGTFTRLNAAGTAVLDGVRFGEIENLNVIGTFKGDEIFAGAGNDVVATGGGDDLIYAGIGSDRVYAQEDNDTVWYGTDNTRNLSSSGGLDSNGNNALFYLDGGRGIDHLSISLAALDSDVVLIGHDPAVEFQGTNLALPNGSAVANFETLGDVMTGSGNDFVAQPDSVDNNIQTGLGSDIIAPGLGFDFVDGGSDFQFGVEIGVVFIPNDGGVFGDGGGFGTIIDVITDRAAFAANTGDTLVLDYSSFDGPGGVIGHVNLMQSQLQLGESINSPFSTVFLQTNEGGYTTGSPNEPSNSLTFRDIERITAKGTNQDDLLVGTYAPLQSTDNEGNPLFLPSYLTQRGGDLLNGLGGDDLLIGNSGSDTLLGGDGNDILIGSDPGNVTLTTFVPGTFGIDVPPTFAHFVSDAPNPNADPYEIDMLTGGAGADTFVLGNAQGWFYGSTAGLPGFDLFVPFPSRAIITDFTPADGDTIQLNGFSADYSTAESNGETFIYHNGTNGTATQVIAEIQNFTGFDLNASYVHYVGGPNGDGVEVAAEQRIRAEADPPPAPIAPLGLLSALNFTPPLGPTSTFTVTQDNDPLDLLNTMFGGAAPAGLVTDSVNTIGDGRAFGTFSNDPFGLGSGIVLSTGQVTELAGPNTVDGSAGPPQDKVLTFVPIGTFNGSTIFRADLSNLGIDLNSLTLRDSNSHVGGSGGMFSGFDLDAVALSHTLLPDFGGVIPLDLNDPGQLPRINAFNFDAASMVFTPGTERTPSPFQSADLANSINGLVDENGARLDLFDDMGLTTDTHGSLSLGDGGSLALNLNQTVSTNGPLYLYVGEAGISSETLSADISVSDGRIAAPADLSTDFGLPGAANDDISFTYTFHVAPGSNVNEIAFQFVLFSEELPEFAGSNFNDSFKILLNGVNLAHLSNGAAANVNNLMASPHVQLSSDVILNPVGTGPAADQTRADAYTKVLDFVGAINPTGENTLTIEVTDVRDGLLDSGILVKAGSFVAGIAPAPNPIGVNGGSISGGSPITVFEGNAPTGIPITIDPGTLVDLSAPVTIDFTPVDSQLDLGGGVGATVSHTFNPGGPFTFNLQVSAPDDHILEGLRPDEILVDVHSTDSHFDGLAVAPLVVNIDDPQAKLSISDVRHAEGDVGVTLFDFTVTRTGGTGALTVDYSSADGTAFAGIGGNGDYTAVHGTLSFAAGELVKTVEVKVNGDINFEPDEIFTVNLANPTGAIIMDGQGVGTIVNDDVQNGDVSGTSANTTVLLAATGGTVTNVPNGRVTLTGVVNKMATGAGNDSIAGNNNGDILDSGAGNDTVRGGTGNDVIIGGAGTDRLTGLAGDDTFVFHLGSGHDTITDFSVGDAIHHDTLDLRSIGFADIASVLAVTADSGVNAVIHLTPTADDITLQGVNKALLQLHQADILV